MVRGLLTEIEKQFDALDQLFAKREVQFDVLAGLLSSEQLRAESSPSGRPIVSGWQSSPYGYRIDPITGQRAWHDGVDFAGKEGTEIFAVASGVVSWSGYRSGYGQMVEVAHGDGLSTRYAHNKENNRRGWRSCAPRRRDRLDGKHWTVDGPACALRSFQTWSIRRSSHLHQPNASLTRRSRTLWRPRNT